MYLDKIVQAQKRGEAKGIPSICSAHPRVLKEALKISGAFDVPVLIEATCNQVNQFGGYTGMTPADFVHFVGRIARENRFPSENIILGGDHLGPSTWQGEAAESAMQKSAVMVHDFVKAGFIKIHLDCSMTLGKNAVGALDIEVSAKRAAQLAKVAETTAAECQSTPPRYVIGTEVPVPGGAKEHEDVVNVTKAWDVERTIQVTREAFYREELQAAWERVVAIVVQPGVEFGDDFILEYHPERAVDLSRFIEGQALVYEAHSTDYQTKDALSKLVEDHFAILKVGPGLTYALREAVFALARIEDELFSKEVRSNFIQVMDDAMVQYPEHWVNYYRGSEEEKAFKRKYSYSDRLRYYWVDPKVQAALERLLKNLEEKSLPPSLLKQFLPAQYGHIRDGEITATPETVISQHIQKVLFDYYTACGG